MARRSSTSSSADLATLASMRSSASAHIDGGAVDHPARGAVLGKIVIEIQGAVEDNAACVAVNLDDYSGEALCRTVNAQVQRHVQTSHGITETRKHRKTNSFP